MEVGHPACEEDHAAVGDHFALDLLNVTADSGVSPVSPATSFHTQNTCLGVAEPLEPV